MAGADDMEHGSYNNDHLNDPSQAWSLAARVHAATSHLELSEQDLADVLVKMTDKLQSIGWNSGGTASEA